jgi:hypothetical protein
MKTFYLKEFNEENFIEISKWLDELWENEWQIYINSGWGSIWVENALLERIENMKIKLIWLFLWSAAFDLFYNFKWKKELSKGCDWIIHIDATNVTVFSHNWQLKVRWDDCEKQRVVVLNFDYEFLTEEEKIKFYDWQDIYVGYERLKLIFNYK